MSDNGQEGISRGSLEFVETSILGTLIPASTSFNVEEALNGSIERLDDSNASPLAAIGQRQSVFFGTFLVQYVGIFLTYHRL